MRTKKRSRGGVALDGGVCDRAAYSGRLIASNRASWREIIDVGNWDNSLALSNPGQSGDPASPYYRNLWPRWLTGGAFPLLYSRELIESVAERRIVLDPSEARNSGKGTK